MIKKINSKKNFQSNFKFPIFTLLFLLLIYTRFINIGWGLPYPMHPDERNMANAIQQLSCELSFADWPINLQECFNPHFFAYGQFPLYLSYLLIWAVRGFRDFGKIVINFEEAVMSLRIISAIASIINVFVLVKIINLIIKKGQTLLIILILILSPFFIQFSHFGTTESLLMLFYSLIIYLSMQLLKRHTTGPVVWLALVSGLAVATKISSVLFLAVPVIVLISKIKDIRANPSLKLKALNLTFSFALFTLILALIFSPHNLINFNDFFGAIKYESDVATGKVLVFYTRQFVDSLPVLFQFKSIFPYALGWPMLILGGLGFFGGVSWRDKKINLLRFAFLIYFLPTAFMFAKWSRFMAPVLPLIAIFAILFLLKIKDQISKLSQKFFVMDFISGFAFFILIFTILVPGITYLSVYQNPDIRFQATDWINNNTPENSFVISETANVVDIPLIYKKNINVVSFDFYNLDESPKLQSELKEYLGKADYIFIPSRRLFANHPRYKYPILNDYYDKLFSGKSGFMKVSEFSAGLNDEGAEETWTVFDHPVIRIYKKVGVGLPDPYKSF